jgi:hypothetical protein
MTSITHPHARCEIQATQTTHIAIRLTARRMPGLFITKPIRALPATSEIALPQRWRWTS